MKLIKLAPKNIKFCPGCPKKELKLTHLPEMKTSPLETKEDNKKTTIIGLGHKTGGKNFSLF